jgi:hypothetical protein
LKQVVDESAQSIRGRRLGLLLVRAEHALEGIDGSEDDFGKLCAVRLTDLPRQNVFEFVSNLAQLLEAASSRITLQGMHGPAHTADEAFVRRALFKFESSVVDDLEKFRGTLKEKRAKLRSAILGDKTHGFTSMRL